jgi:hypothetical protein
MAGVFAVGPTVSPALLASPVWGLDILVPSFVAII